MEIIIGNQKVGEAHISYAPASATEYAKGLAREVYEHLRIMPGDLKYVKITESASFAKTPIVEVELMSPIQSSFRADKAKVKWEDGQDLIFLTSLQQEYTMPGLTATGGRDSRCVEIRVVMTGQVLQQANEEVGKWGPDPLAQEIAALTLYYYYEHIREFRKPHEITVTKALKANCMPITQIS